MNTPIIAASRASMKKANSRTRDSMDSQEHRSASGVRNVVRRISSRLMPSTPT